MPLKKPLVGVGLRHPHYREAIEQVTNIDFVEIHAENFFMAGGASLEVLNNISHQYPLSIHGTSLGLGSNQIIPEQAIKTLKKLVDHYKPLLVSDHLCFTWSRINSKPVHSGDLLPIAFNELSLSKTADNISRVQDILGRNILAENLSAYLTMPHSTIRETDFLNRLCDKTGCKLLVDVNNVMVNEINNKSQSPLENARDWLAAINSDTIGEIHLAGCTIPPQGAIMVDDHSQPVAGDTWQAYRSLITDLPVIPPTLIEWDTHLPTWSALLDEANKARNIIKALTAKNAHE